MEDDGTREFIKYLFFLGEFSYVLMLYIYYRVPQIRSQNMNILIILISWELVSDIIISLPGANYQGEFLCTAQATLLSFVTPIPPIWAFAISLRVYLVLLKTPLTKLGKKFTRFFNALSILYGSAFALDTLFFGENKAKGGDYWCLDWRPTNIVLIYGGYWIFITLCIFFGIASVHRYRRILKQISQFKIQRRSEKEKEIFRGQIVMLSVPSIFIITYLPASIDRIKKIVFNNYDNWPWLNILRSVTLPLGGPLYLTVFLYIDGNFRHLFRRQSLDSEQRSLSETLGDSYFSITSDSSSGIFN